MPVCRRTSVRVRSVTIRLLVGRGRVAAGACARPAALVHEARAGSARSPPAGVARPSVLPTPPTRTEAQPGAQARRDALRSSTTRQNDRRVNARAYTCSPSTTPRDANTTIVESRVPAGRRRRHDARVFPEAGRTVVFDSRAVRHEVTPIVGLNRARRGWRSPSGRWIRRRPWEGPRRSASPFTSVHIRFTITISTPTLRLRLDSSVASVSRLVPLTRSRGPFRRRRLRAPASPRGRSSC